MMENIVKGRICLLKRFKEYIFRVNNKDTFSDLNMTEITPENLPIHTLYSECCQSSLVSFGELLQLGSEEKSEPLYTNYAHKENYQQLEEEKKET